MLQIEIRPYASDALEDAMRLAQVKAMNSYSFSDCFNYLNYTWADIYNSLAFKDGGYYSKTIQITKRLTKIPPHVQNTLLVYKATRPTARRFVLSEAGNNDQLSLNTYRISGTDLFCPAAESTTIWLEYLPSPPQLFFPLYNRDPKIWKQHDVVRENKWGIYILEADGNREWTKMESLENVEHWELVNRVDSYGNIDISERIENLIPDTSLWKLTYISCDFPYLFLSFRHTITNEHLSGFFTKDLEWVEYNPFAYLGRNSNVEYIQCKCNDKTGMGVIVRDWNDTENDEPKIKELGWTPDSLLTYPAPCVYRYLVARLAEKFAAMNESNIMGVQNELDSARFAFEAFVEKGKSSFKRINIVTGPMLEDWL